MAKRWDILRPRPKIDPAELDPAELELYEARIAARIADLLGHGTADSSTEALSMEAGAEAADEDPARDPHDLVDGTAPSTEEWPGEPRPPIVVERHRDLVPVMAEREALFVGVAADHIQPVTAGWARDGRDVRDVGGQDPTATALVEAPALADGAIAGALTAGEAATLELPVRERAKGATLVPTQPKEHAPHAPRARRAPAAHASKARSRRAPAATPPSCPYCATILQPPPATSRRCHQCLHRIVVKRVEGRVVYLTEAAVEVFESERQRIASSGRWTRERQRWLKLAASVGAPAQRVARLEAAKPSQTVVDAARALYVATVDRSFNVAKRERRWEDASLIRREQALAFYRIAGSPSTPPAETVALLREGATAELRGFARIARDAELVGAACCDACRADDGRIFPIASELQAPRLPHAGCPRGLCRCRWDLAVRDRTMVQRNLRRRPRSGRRDARSESSPSV